jgi:phosphoribosylformimino-5-aminoimidazole carboxamide ribotide isomerase
VIVIPAIDLMDGKVVRLSRGDFATRTIYSDRPAEFAEAFRKAGARRVHVVDLDGARAGRPVNTDVVRAIVATGVEVELGGGIRSIEAVEEACLRFPGRVVAGIDARDGEVKVAGWAQGTGLPAVDVARRVAGAGVTLIEYTDVARDGMFTGVDAAGAARLQAETGVMVVASGGVASLADVGVCKAAGLAGVIVGKALYEKRIDLAQAIGVAEG